MMERDQEMMLWLTAWIEDPAGTAEDADFKDFLQQEDNRTAFVELLKSYRQARKITLCHRIDSSVAWEEVLKKTARMRQRRLFVRIGRVTAAAAVVALCFFLWHPGEQPQPDLLVSGDTSQRAVIRVADGEEYALSNSTGGMVAGLASVDIYRDEQNNIRYTVKDSASVRQQNNTLSVPRGGFYSIVLTDGTRVRVNAASQLTYPVIFSGEERVVYLHGEAYFEVAANAQHPFRVVCGNHQVVVTGTKFNVSAYTDNMCTTLAEGAVTVHNGKIQQALNPGEQAVVSDEDIWVQSVDVSIYTAWTRGEFAFDSSPLSEILETLGRWYDVKFHLLDEELGKVTFTFSAPQDENLMFIVKQLENVSTARFTEEAEGITVSSKK